MEKLQSSSRAIDLGWKIPLIAIAYFFGNMIGGALVTAARLPWPELPNPVSAAETHILGVVGAVLMAGCLALLARSIRGSLGERFLIMAAFTYVVFGLSNQIEASIFTTFGGTRAMVLFFIFPCAAGALAAALLVRPAPEQLGPAAVWAGRPVSGWWWRPLVAWLAFPVIYLFFGMIVSPIVVPFYEQQQFGLALPSWGTILPVVSLRSALCLAVTLPLLARWSGSRRSLLWTLGLVFWAMMGLIGLATTTFFPPVMRVVHSLEILGDALVYAWVLVALLVPKTPAAETEASLVQA